MACWVYQTPLPEPLLTGLQAIEQVVTTSQWRHNERDGISNHQPHDCLLSILFQRTWRKHQSSTSLAFVQGIHRWPVDSQHTWPVTRKMFPFDDVIMDQINTISLEQLHLNSPSTRWRSFCSGCNVSITLLILFVAFTMVSESFAVLYLSR